VEVNTELKAQAEVPNCNYCCQSPRLVVDWYLEWKQSLLTKEHTV